METKISSNRLYDEVLDNGGFTYLPSENKLITSGFACPIANTEVRVERKDFSPMLIASFRDMIAMSKHKDLAIGCWWNPRDGVFYLDVIEIEQSLTLALRKGILSEQQSIYDLNRGLTIWLPSPQKAGTETQKEMYLLQKVKELEEQYS